MLEFFDSLASKFSSLGDQIISTLPLSPIVWLEYNSQIKQYLAWVNWFIPIYSMIATLEAWLSCILVYYVIQVLLRWYKVIE